MGDRGGAVPRALSRRRRITVAVLVALALCTGTGVAWGAWAAGGTTTGPADAVTAWTLPATATTCTDTDGQVFETAAVTWPETSTPHALDYTATINDVAAPVTDDGATRTVVIDQAVLQQLFGGLFGGTLTVRVTASLPGTSWTAPVATETVQAGVIVVPPGLTLECTS
ncbi:hypothetical protein ACIG47_08465 [Promicromonospora sp. NPDC052451]|uniref:hypothetical protein n=1 Tax=Promicromonospora sp. NPDC052451 TaxID=3364407 RepID=UPI0037C84E1D